MDRSIMSDDRQSSPVTPPRVVKTACISETDSEAAVLCLRPFIKVVSHGLRSSACRQRPGSSHGSRPVLRTPVNGAKGTCRNVSVPTSLSHGTSPRPVFTGRGDCASRCLSRQKRTVKSVPLPTSDLTISRARWRVRMCLTMARPRPVPFFERLSSMLTR
jgi:hypothetical protein